MIKRLKKTCAQERKWIWINRVAPFLLFTLLALLARAVLFPFVSRDYTIFLQPWFEQLKANGGLSAIGLPIGDYTPFYIYILAALTYVPLDSLTTIKIVSCLSDLVLAFYAMLLVQRITANFTKSITAYTGVLFLPTVLLNSGAWAQCDSMYAAAIIACIYYAVCQKPNGIMAAFAIAFTLKLQAVFLAPLLFVLLLEGKIKLRHCIWPPAVYLAAALPAACMGRSWQDILTIYFRQAGSYEALSMNIPNIYAWVGNVQQPQVLAACGVIVCASVILFGVYLLVSVQFRVTPDFLLCCALLCAITVPFLLPHMHERYFYLADVLGLLYCVRYPRQWYISPLITGPSLYTYCTYLFGASGLSLPMLSVVILIAVLLVARQLVRIVKLSCVPGVISKKSSI